jgi:hypothetical protein
MTESAVSKARGSLQSHPILGWTLLGVLVAGLLLLLALGVLRLEADGDEFELKSGIAPAEYLYLDPERVGSYLAQAENGLTESEKRQSKAITNLSGEAGLEGVKLGGSLQTERSIEETIKPTDNSRLHRLVSRLQSREVKIDELPALSTLDFNARVRALRKALTRVPPGGFVKIEHAQVVPPRYVRLYYSLKQAVSDRSVLALGLKPRDLPSARDFVDRVGENPRLPLFVRLGSPVQEPRSLAPEPPDRGLPSARPDASEERVTLLLTAQFANFAPQSSLFRTTLTVVGKVIHRPVSVPSGTSADYRHEYFDEETVSTFAPPLRAAPDALQRKLGVRRGQIEPQLRAQVRVVPPGLVILPVAIFR